VCTASRYDVCMILSQRTFNPVLRLHHTPDGSVFSFDDMCQFSGDVSLLDDVFESQSRLQSLQLTDEENCVLAAFTVMSTGNNASSPQHVTVPSNCMEYYDSSPATLTPHVSWEHCRTTHLVSWPSKVSK